MLVCLNRKPSSTLLNKIKSKLAGEVSTAKSIALPSLGSGEKLGAGAGKQELGTALQ